MSTSRSIFRPLFTVTCLALTLLGLRNTYADNSEERKLAEQIACGTPTCSTHPLSESRNPISQAFAFQILNAKGEATRSARVVQVECKREFVFLGSYTCGAKP
jgi:hypothetical protein